MFCNTNGFGRKIAKKATLIAITAAAFAGLGMAPATVQAGHNDRPRVNIDFDIRIGDRHREPEYAERKVRVWVPPQHRTVCDRQWIEPIYENRCERVWIEPIYKTRCERVWIPERFELREVKRFDRYCGRFVTIQERVCVSPGRWETRDTRVCVREGRFEEVHKRVCVREGRFETIERQELVCEGHFEYRTERVRVGHDNHQHIGGQARF